MAKLLLVDDDIELVELLAELLQLEGFEVDTANNGKEALDKLDNSYHLVLLDIMMPVLNGIETLKQIRQHFTTPVMMLTARGDEIDRVIGLELGADDYLPKPFNDRELVARIKAILRRTELANSVNENKSEENQQIEFCGLTLYPGRQQVLYEDKNLELTGTEFALLQILIANPGQILSREHLSMEILGKPLTPFDRAIDMHMSNLRKKLPPRNDDSPWFKTLRGKGYLLVASK
ncbi:envelope stress response regulator transcription factor CpxR [Avibacterium gallinarum]|uniref:Alkaline phosphatase synthesis transcriptional regulatory protein phoP n=4 Tax=Avibacterium TaxID=292486 RepID=A0A3S5DJ55_AVIVO|nr:MULTISPECIES: envelope stress response regulator transcription factor CpxR [Avibacterium]POY43089.1 DNA-binding response regulator [Avibacterium endocarditidis]VEB21957.1 Alkaline phosphatase synthesis transcriptional regulatory protein phoP [Avibacterium volantium]VGM95997.1 Alkaline phosphatase synthesis transcriptional regulatory protein phoP [uncultured Avibacterium sp.]